MIEKIIGGKINELVLGSAYIFYGKAGDLDFESAYKILSCHRREKIDALRREQDKMVSLLSELLLIYGLRKLGYDVALPLEFEILKKGKPHLADCPWNFNISHTEDIAVVAISRDIVGVDVENATRKSDAICKYLTEGEKQTDYPTSYIWTRKEAVAKADGNGISVGLQGIDTSKDTVTLNNRTYRLITTPLEDFYLSVALQ